LKAHGKSAKDSYLLNGYALNTGRAAQGMPTRVTPARIACLDFNLQKTKMQLGVQVLVTDPRELEKIRQRYLQSVFRYFRIWFAYFWKNQHCKYSLYIFLHVICF
jgi:chaperonin GroEL (HSP60 family)